MVKNPCHECGRELNKTTAELDVDHKGTIVIVCPACFWGDEDE